MNIDITKVAEFVITLILLLLTTFVIPYIKAKVNDTKLEEIKKWTKIAVQAAEMIYNESGKGKEKKAYVLKFLNDKGYTIDIDSLDNMIESAVLELKLALGE